ncbi:hypothetical protein BMW24_001435 [Mycobacterium heckeshornense]|uniref:Uncharacterized protein n=1 Tax=Mycobacterium heckeshornense TaxID=110505 RepID=A0A2G8BJ27_9MYCO|nr:hypothetical protein [Mycobacterium heckeshornense]KMV21218.1 hypothetical protein ACT16_17945 [Mycobacterium heckeshornense]MCV7035665.1 hypothetical protein [Mycobacterium heckeshornense]PIJ37797.1 hypothetical protein BMW24_001435 [Mycobacterium heckeshornense]BCO37737.1 hypothetical protein MHEC_41700 [Mycobacterium heckeshornense]
MSDLTPDDVRRWDAAAVLKVFQVAASRATTLYRFGEDLGQTGLLLAEWQGEAGSAFHSSLGRLRTDIDKDGHESTQVAAAVSMASADVQSCKAMMSQVDETAETLGFTITADWKVNIGETAALLMGPQEAGLQRQILQTDLDTVKVKAHTTDHELAAAMRAAVGDGVDSDGGAGAYSSLRKQSGEQPTNDDKAQNAQPDGGAGQLSSRPTSPNGALPQTGAPIPPPPMNTHIGNLGDGIDKSAATAGEYAAVPQRSAGLGPTQGQLNRAAARATEGLETFSQFGKRLSILGNGLEAANGVNEGINEVKNGKSAGDAVVDVAPKTAGSIAGGMAGAAVGAEYGAGIGASAGSVVPGLGTVAGGVIGAGVGAVVGGLAGSEVGKGMGEVISKGWHAISD